ncbi:hypothetical protein FQA39_LY07004 [Lamprigera yunnana]|nr:hypothetical protein FQA39_LY07004 [Lamprigera yunnana]
MEELSAQEFSRLNEQEKASYLQQLLGEESTEEDFVSNNEDEDWFPLPDELPEEISDNEEIVENRDDEVEEGNDDIEEIAENPSAISETRATPIVAFRTVNETEGPPHQRNYPSYQYRVVAASYADLPTSPPSCPKYRVKKTFLFECVKIVPYLI